jgi:hypothetical protein
MGAMEYGANALQGNPYAGSSSFIEVSPTRSEQRFDIGPRDVGSDRILKNRLERASMLPLH